MTALALSRWCNLSEVVRPWRLACVLALSCALPASAWAQSDPPAPGDEPAEATAEGGTAGEDKTGDDKSGDSTTPELAADPPAPTADTVAEAASIPEYDRIRTPASPAFSILGVSPTDIERPNTPRDFAITVASTLESGADLLVPRNVAVEVAPYWFVGHKRSTYDDYLKSGLGTNVLRNLSVSVASQSREVPVVDDMGMETGDTSTESTLSLGLRTQLYTGKSRADICGGDLQKKTLALARSLAGDEKLEDPALADKELLAQARAQTWKRLLPLMQRRDAARKKLAQVAAILGDKDATAEAKTSAGKEHSQAAAEAIKEQAAIDEILATMRARVQRTQDRLTAARETLAAATTDAAKAKLGAEVATLEKQLTRALAAASVAEQAAEISAVAAQARLVDIEAERQAASSGRTKARDARIQAEYKSRLDKLKDVCKDASAARMGWNISVAGALAWRFPESKFSDGDLDAAAGWLTVAHTWKQGISAAALARVTWARMDESDRATLFDTGARIIFARARYAVSGETVVRTNTDQRGVRAAVMGEYMVSKGKWLGISFGKDFSNGEDIFTLANLTWGVGGESELGKAKEEQAR